MRVQRGIAIVLIGLLFLTACQPATTPPTVAPTTPPSPTPTAVPPTPTPSVTVVTDALGRTVEFPTLPQRIVAAGKAVFMITDALYLFPQARERVIGFGRGAQTSAPFLTLVDEQYPQKVLLEPDANAEQIAPLNPDVVVLKSYMAETLGKPLETLGIKVVYVDLETPEQYQRDLATLGQLFGDPARAAALIRFYSEKTDAVKAIAASLPEHQRPRVLVVQYTESDGTLALKVPPAGWIQTQMVELAGGIAVWKEAATGGGWATVNFEQIAAWNPDLILVIDYKGDPAQTVATLKSDPQWQALAAVQNGRLYGFAKDFYSWDQPDTRWILGLSWVANRLYPERFPMDWEQTVIEFYQQLYGIEAAKVKEQVMPALKGDF